MKNDAKIRGFIHFLDNHEKTTMHCMQLAVEFINAHLNREASIQGIVHVEKAGNDGVIAATIKKWKENKAEKERKDCVDLLALLDCRITSSKMLQMIYSTFDPPPGSSLANTDELSRIQFGAQILQTFSTLQWGVELRRITLGMHFT